MQNVERDLKEAFRGTLSGNYEERRQTIERVFSKDAKFWCATACTKAYVHTSTRALYAGSCDLLCVPESDLLTDQHIDIWTVCWNRHLAHVAYGAQALSLYHASTSY